MVLNPALYAALKARFGTVKISHAGVPAEYHVAAAKHGRFEVKFTSGGEQYQVSCPYCGDTRHRLEIGHKWGMTAPRMKGAFTGNLKCYNEDCKQVYSAEFYQPLLDYIYNQGRALTIMAAAEPEPERPKVQLRMPLGCVPLQELPADHRVHEFLREKYNGLTAEYLGAFYGATYTDAEDTLYPLCRKRIVFPITMHGELVGWQGRSVLPLEKRKWLLPPGFCKVIYNADRVGPMRVPIINEGITSSVCCGPTGVAVFGKDISEPMLKEFGRRWPTAVIALDPECAVPDPNASGKILALDLKARLDSYLKIPSYILQWPAEAIAAATRKADYQRRKMEARKAKQPAPPAEDHKVPDSADYGLVAMAGILSQIPLSHRGIA